MRIIVRVCDGIVESVYCDEKESVVSIIDVDTDNDEDEEKNKVLEEETKLLFEVH